MGRYSKLLAAAGLALLVACSEKPADDGVAPPPLPTANTLGEQQVLGAADYLSQPRYAEANLDNGARQAQICRACHSLDEGGANMIGPSLFGFFGTTAGAREGFEFSAALREADFVWTPRALDAWLAQPGRFLPGNRMTFAGVYDPGDRDDLIAYLLRVTSGIQPGAEGSE